GVVAAPHLFERVGDLADRGPRPHRRDRQLEEIAIAELRRVCQGAERLPHLRRIAPRPDLLEPRNLRLAYRAVVDLADVDLRLLGELKLVHADDDVLAAIDARLPPRRGLLDAQLGHAGLDGFSHAAHRFDLVDDAESLACQGVRQRLHEVRPGPRIDDL